ncbi:MAG: dipeptidase [Chitinophagaceae bacterium]|nr:dipeptidase [Chitinophagaceae bacterium]
MKRFSFFLTGVFLLLAANSNSQNLQRFHRKATLVDTHNDALSELVLEGKDLAQPLNVGHSDLYRWRAGGMNIQFMSVFTGDKARNKEGYYADANQEIDSLSILVLRNHEQLALARNMKEIKRGMRLKKLVMLIGVEGGHMIEDDMAKLEALAKRGMCYLTLTWNNSTSWASSAMDEYAVDAGTKTMNKGLNEFGKNVVRRLNELGIMVDLSHVGEKTFYDALAVSSKPVILSHSSVYNICPVFRNVTDDQIRAVAANKGVICINFYAGFISAAYDQRITSLQGEGRKQIQDSILKVVGGDSTRMLKIWSDYRDKELDAVRPGVKEVVDHIEYIVKLVGDDYVGLGADYDGVTSVPIGLEDVSTYPKITEELMRRGFSRRSVKKILGKNVLRVMKANMP